MNPDFTPYKEAAKAIGKTIYVWREGDELKSSINFWMIPTLNKYWAISSSGNVVVWTVDKPHLRPVK